MNFRYFYNKNNERYYRVEVDKKNNITRNSKAWCLSRRNQRGPYYAGQPEGDVWQIVDSSDPTNPWKYTFFEKCTMDRIIYYRFTTAIQIIKNTRGSYRELSYEDFILEMI